MNASLFASVNNAWLLAGWTMIHFLWIGTLVALAAFAMRAMLRSATPTVRYGIALVSLAVLGALPVAISTWLAIYSPPLKGGAGRGIEKSPLVSSTNLPPILVPSQSHRQVELHRSPFALVPPATVAAASPTVLSRSNNAPFESSPDPALTEKGNLFAPLISWVAYLPWFWLIGTPITFAVTATGLLGTRRLRRASQILEDDTVAPLCARLAASLRIARHVAVAVCDRIAAPVLVGILRPVILLPPAALTGWSPDEIEMVLLHELAHVRRWDNLVNLIQRLIESLLFFHPAVWLISNWARREREACCDAAVVARTEHPHAYAELLVALAAQMPRSVLFHPVATSAMAAGPLRSRIRRILKLDEDPMLISGKSFSLVLAALLTAATLALLYLPASGHAESSADGATKNTKTTNPEDSAQEAAAQRAQTINNLKNLSLGLLNYESAKKSLPPHAFYDVDRPLLSWRVLILPYLGETQLYKEFHLWEPWNSEHNRKLIARMPQVFKNPKFNEPEKTNYLAVVGKECVFNGTQNGIRLAKITDGTAQTIALVEADRFVEWTRPDDWNFDRQHPTSGLGYVWPDQWHATMVDGSVHTFNNNEPADVVGIHFTRNGGESRSLQESAGRDVSEEAGSIPAEAGPGGPSATPDSGRRAKFPSFEEQKLVDLAYKRLGVELETVSEDDLKIVQQHGYDGGVRISVGNNRSIPGTFQTGDILVGLHVWPTTNMNDVAKILQRDDLAELSPLKFYVVRWIPGDGETHTAVVVGRVSVNLPQGAFTTTIKPRPLVAESDAANPLAATTIKPEPTRTAPGTNPWGSPYSSPPLIALPGETTPPPLPTSPEEYSRMQAERMQQLIAIAQAERRNAPPLPQDDYSTPSAARSPAGSGQSFGNSTGQPVHTNQSLADMQLRALEQQVAATIARKEVAIAMKNQAKADDDIEALNREVDAANRELEQAKRALEIAKRETNFNKTSQEIVITEQRVKALAQRVEACIEIKEVAAKAAAQAKDPSAIERAKRDLEGVNGQLEDAKRALEAARRQLEELKRQAPSAERSVLRSQSFSSPNYLTPSDPNSKTVIELRESPMHDEWSSVSPVAPQTSRAEPAPVATPGPTYPVWPTPAENWAAVNSAQPTDPADPIAAVPNGDTIPVAIYHTAPDGKPVYETQMVPRAVALRNQNANFAVAPTPALNEMPTYMPAPAPAATNQNRADAKSALRYDGKTFDQWQNSWRTELSSEKRMAAIKALAAFGANGDGKAAAQAILDVAGQYDWSQSTSNDSLNAIKKACLDAFGGNGGSLPSQLPAADALPALLATSHSQNKAVRQFAATALRQYAHQDEAAMAALVELSHDDDKALRAIAWETLRHVYSPDSSAAERAVHEALAGTDTNSQIAALKTIWNYDLTKTAPVASNPAITNIPELFPLLFSPDRDVRRNARETIERLKSDDATQIAGKLVVVLKDDSQKSQRIEAIRALAHIPRLAKPAIDTLRPLVKSDDKPLAIVATAALHRMLKPTEYAKLLHDELGERFDLHFDGQALQLPGGEKKEEFTAFERAIQDEEKQLFP